MKRKKRCAHNWADITRRDGDKMKTFLCVLCNKKERRQGD